MLSIHEQYNGREYAYDMESRLFRDNIIYLSGPIDSCMTYYITSALQYLEAADPSKDVKLIINSPGGEVTSGLAIVDVMETIKNDVETVCLGMAASMASIILAAGTKGKRYIYPHSKVLIHQPLISGGIGGQASEIEIIANNILDSKKTINQLLSKYTGHDISKIEKDTDRDNYLSAKDAIEYGIVDKIYSGSV